MGLEDILSFEKEVSPEEEKILWEEFWVNPENPELRIRLVELYLPLVLNVVRKLPMNIRENVQSEELLSSGVVGLHSAISNFSEDKNSSFAGYAYKRIKGAIIDELRKQDHLTRTQRNYYREICAAINRLTSKLSRSPTDIEIAEETKLSVADIDRYIGMGSQVLNLDDEFGDGLSYIDVIPDNSSVSPRESAHNALAMDKLREHFRELDEREQKILFLRHYEDMSVKEIAKVMEVSEGRISQIYHKIILKLRALMQVSA